jgi:excisionase family DNA binding protein
MQSDIESALIGISHLAERLELSHRTIHRILANGNLSSMQTGGRYLSRLSGLSHWLAGHEVLTPGVTNLNHRGI